eukprot:9468487-Pyramimonas_sp.AAC.1
MPAAALDACEGDLAKIQALMRATDRASRQADKALQDARDDECPRGPRRALSALLCPRRRPLQTVFPQPLARECQPSSKYLAGVLGPPWPVGVPAVPLGLLAPWGTCVSWVFIGVMNHEWAKLATRPSNPPGARAFFGALRRCGVADVSHMSSCGPVDISPCPPPALLLVTGSILPHLAPTSPRPLPGANGVIPYPPTSWRSKRSKDVWHCF